MIQTQRKPATKQMCANTQPSMCEVSDQEARYLSVGCLTPQVCVPGCTSWHQGWCEEGVYLLAFWTEPRCQRQYQSEVTDVTAVVINRQLRNTGDGFCCALTYSKQHQTWHPDEGFRCVFTGLDYSVRGDSQVRATGVYLPVCWAGSWRQRW